MRNRIKDSIRKIAGSVVQPPKKTKGRARKQLNEKNKNFHFRESKIKIVEQWKEELGSLNNGRRTLQSAQRHFNFKLKKCYHHNIQCIDHHYKAFH